MATDRNHDRELADELAGRFEEVYLNRGHVEWMAHAQRLEEYYRAGGNQWRAGDRAAVEATGRRPTEIDVVKPAINAMAGYQIANRVDVSFVPRGGEADEHSAKLMSKVVRQVMDNTSWRFKETDCFLDGLIQQRGFLDVRMDYQDNDLGEIAIRVMDPLDSIPDPDATSYDPDDWCDFHEARWMTASQIEQQHGADVAREVEARSEELQSSYPLGAEDGVQREGFGQRSLFMNSYGYGYYGDKGPWRRYRIVHRQVNEYANLLVARWPTGDIRVVEGYSREQLAWLLERGIPVFKRRMRQVREQVFAPGVLLHDAPSPYSHITAVMFTPYFRRGKTIGAIDNLTSVQDMLNKLSSQFEHIVNSTANSGWQYEEGQLVNMDEETELPNYGAMPGLLLGRRPGTPRLDKIQPNPVPAGIASLMEFAYRNAQLVSGVDENMLGLQKDLSGVAVQSLQYAAQQKLAIVLDNLSRSRRMVVQRVQEMVQRYMGAERVLRIAEDDAYGVTRHVPYVLNQRMDDGSILNDLTIGEYDLVLSEQPAQVTFDNSQFEQMKAMRKDMGIPIPDTRVIRSSNLMDKSEIAEEMEKQASAADPLAEAEAALKQAQARKAEAEAVNKAIEAQFSAVKTAREIVFTPQTAALADALLRSGGYKDQDAAPIVPEAPADAIDALADFPAEPENSHPLFPANPDAGLDRGLTDTTGA